MESLLMESEYELFEKEWASLVGGEPQKIVDQGNLGTLPISCTNEPSQESPFSGYGCSAQPSTYPSQIPTPAMSSCSSSQTDKPKMRMVMKDGLPVPVQQGFQPYLPYSQKHECLLPTGPRDPMPNYTPSCNRGQLKGQYQGYPGTPLYRGKPLVYTVDVIENENASVEKLSALDFNPKKSDEVFRKAAYEPNLHVHVGPAPVMTQEILDWSNRLREEERAKMGTFHNSTEM